MVTFTGEGSAFALAFALAFSLTNCEQRGVCCLPCRLLARIEEFVKCRLRSVCNQQDAMLFPGGRYVGPAWLLGDIPFEISLSVALIQILQGPGG